jgi:hypothetical protein
VGLNATAATQYAAAPGRPAIRGFVSVEPRRIRALLTQSVGLATGLTLNNVFRNQMHHCEKLRKKNGNGRVNLWHIYGLLPLLPQMACIGLHLE